MFSPVRGVRLRRLLFMGNVVLLIALVTVPTIMDTVRAQQAPTDTQEAPRMITMVRVRAARPALPVPTIIVPLSPDAPAAPHAKPKAGRHPVPPRSLQAPAAGVQANPLPQPTQAPALGTTAPQPGPSSLPTYSPASSADAEGAAGRQQAPPAPLMAATGSGITEFPVLGQPFAITAGPDARLWFSSSDMVGLIGTAGDKLEFDGSVDRLVTNAIAKGPDGNIWFTKNTADAIGRVTAAFPNSFSTFTITAVAATSTTVGSPQGIAAGADGNLWFTEASCLATIST
jgi:hypothetical protein